MASNAEKRLARILSDEDYGPKLARLRGQDEKRILTLIDENKGREARKEILRLDEARRAKRRVTAVSRPEKERKAIANILLQQDFANSKRVAANVALMTIAELDFAGTATKDELDTKARLPASRKNTRGDDVNPFWYH